MKYFKNTSWLMGEKILRMTVGLFVGVWVARYLGPEQFGLFSYAQSFVGLFAIISSFGLDSIVVRELVKDEARKDELLGTSFVLKVVGALLTLIVLGIAVNFTSNDSYTNRLVFIIASATVFQSFNVIDLYFQSKVLSKYVVYANIIALLTSSAIKVALILNESPLEYFAWLVLFDSFVLALGLIYFFVRKKGVNTKHLTFKMHIAIALLKDSWPLILGGVAVSVYMQIDIVMIKEMLGSTAVGQYSVAVKLSELWYFIPIVIAPSLFPALMNAKKKDESIYYERLQNLYDLLAFLAIIIAFVLSFFSDLIVGLLYGEAYHQAGSVLMIYAWAGVAVFLGIASSQFLTIENLLHLSMYRTIIGSLVNVALNLILIPAYGIEGAAFATLGSYFIATFLLVFFTKTRSQCVFMLKSLLILPFILRVWRMRVA